jgi:hypothetical protein
VFSLVFPHTYNVDSEFLNSHGTVDQP